LSDEVYVNIASVWEYGIKNSLGKLSLSFGGVKEFLKEIHNNGFELTGIKPCYIKIVETLPFIHRDPFDRLLVAAALKDDMVIITADENIQKYEVKWVW
jgi:PIN domain nuclease of toxin-antitoxin system